MEGIDSQGHLVSIILPVYNGENYLSQAIESCLIQTYKCFELIIINDASTDGSLNIAKGYASRDDRIKIITNPNNQKLPASLNIGHRAAKGKFITWTSHDNFYAPDAIEKLLSCLLKTQSDVVFSDFCIIDSSGNLIGRYGFCNKNTILLDNIIRASFIYRVEVFQRNGGYNASLFKIEDYAFWLQASLHSKFHHIPEELYYYRRHSASLTARKTIQQFSYRTEYILKVKRMYQVFFNTLESDWSEELSTQFKNLHLHQPIDVKNFLRNYSNFKKKLSVVFKKYDKAQILDEIDLRIRQNILRYSSNQNALTLFYIILNRPKILYSYSKKKSLKIIYHSVFN